LLEFKDDVKDWTMVHGACQLTRKAYDQQENIQERIYICRNGMGTKPGTLNTHNEERFNV